MTNKSSDSTFKIESQLSILYFIPERYFQPSIQVGHLSYTFTEDIKIISGFAKYLFIGIEDYGSASFTGFANLSYLLLRNTLPVLLLVHLATTPDPAVQPGGERIYYRSSYAVQTTWHLIGMATKFSPGMKHRHYRFQSGYTGGGVNIYRNATPIILNTDSTILLKGDHDFSAAARHGFINAIVGNLID